MEFEKAIIEILNWSLKSGKGMQPSSEWTKQADLFGLLLFITVPFHFI
jgi:hypothetical protein